VYRHWSKFWEIFLHKILHVNDTPHRLALGAAAGIFVAWTPTFGFQTILAIALAALIRGNKAIVIPMAWITNPFTNVPIYGFNYLVGHFLLTGSWSTDPVIKAQIINLIKKTMHMDIWHSAFWITLWTVTKKIGLEMWLGSTCVGLIVALITYFLVYWAVLRYRQHRAKKHPLLLTSHAESKSND